MINTWEDECQPTDNRKIYKSATHFSKWKKRKYTTEKEIINASSWRTVFGALEDYDIKKTTVFQPKKERPSYSPQRNNTRNSGITFLSTPRIERLSLFPWRAAMVEIIIKLDLYPHTLMIGSIVARLERYPHHIPACDEEYTFYSIPKKSGGRRKISAPSEDLKSLQKYIYHTLSSLSSPNSASHGYEIARSNITNARVHEQQPVVIRLDIKRAFENTSRQNVEKVLKKDLEKLQLSPRAVSLLSEMLTQNNALPTGGPCSPYLLNRVLYDLDTLMEKESSAMGLAYTRYADDLVISGKRAAETIPIARKALSEIGYSINKEKTRIFTDGGRQTVTGLTVNAKTNIARVNRRLLRAAVHHWNEMGSAHFIGTQLSLHSLKGHLSYFKSVSPEGAKKLLERLTNSELL